MIEENSGTCISEGVDFMNSDGKAILSSFKELRHKLLNFSYC